MNYFHLVHKVIILMLFTSMLKICNLVKMKENINFPEGIFHAIIYTFHEKVSNTLSMITSYQKIKD